jgi:osmotically-inducible protein OsmY
MNWKIFKLPSLLVSITAALLLSVSAIAGDKASGATKADDKQLSPLASAVKTRLQFNEYTSDLDIRVEADGDVVILKGDVPTQEKRELAETIASNTLGVEEVDNQLSVEDERG